jgi:hypothetical protein
MCGKDSLEKTDVKTVFGSLTSTITALIDFHYGVTWLSCYVLRERPELVEHTVGD